jgi:aromatic ring-opening dioxygenase catalytic subunit (LigB family)
MTERERRLPTYFISHGGGPWPWMKDLIPGDWTPLEDSLTSMAAEIGVKPKAILIVSGHWEEAEFTLQAHPNPPMYYDYGGMPAFTYQIKYPAPGSPRLAERVMNLLHAAAIPSRQDPARGFDHGVFAPLAVAYPDAEVPVVQLSLRRDLDPRAHLAAGRALAPLRDEGVLIIGSGFSYHNLTNFGPRGFDGGADTSKKFEAWLTETLVESPLTERTTRLIEWEQAPLARESHPTEDHLIPLMIAVGAAEQEAGERIYLQHDFMGTVTSASYRFGDAWSRP